MKRSKPPSLVIANGATGPRDGRKALVLHYLPGQAPQRVRIGLPRFVQNLFYIPPRTLDLLEIAAYVFAADRCLSRGPKDAVEYHRWSRSLEFYVRVRDFDFWNQAAVKRALEQALLFMTGDAAIIFNFEPGHSTPPTSLFDRPDFSVDPDPTGIAVTLFSGGIDSLTGALELFEATKGKVLLVSHQSQAGTTRTQRRLAEAISLRYPGRMLHYQFECTLRGIRASEETQRTRSFLYTSIAYAIASAYGQNQIYVYENGVTSMNLHRREDLYNARASRTTHPKTMGQMAALFSLLAETDFRIKLPYLLCTKKDVIERLQLVAPELLSSAVSCSRTFQVHGQATHCGYCFQCVDRRIASFAAAAEGFDHRGLYTHDIVADPIDDREARTTIVDYIRQAISFAEGTIDYFEKEYLSEIADIFDYGLQAASDADALMMLWDLFRRHGEDVRYGLIRMRQLCEDVFKPLSRNSLLSLISDREYLKPCVRRLAESIGKIIRTAVPEMFARNRPKDEPDLNAKLGALLRTHEEELRTEHPTSSFACAKVVPDHLIKGTDLLIEAKYIRDSTSPSKATEGIASDLTKYPSSSFILFVVYDPMHAIQSDETFRSDIEAKGRNWVLIVR